MWPVAVDTNDSCCTPLYKIQILLLRRILGLPNNSIITPVFTELELLPLRTHRLELSLKFLSAAVSLSNDDLVSLALQASSNLRLSGNPSWLMDIDWAVRNLPGSHECLPALSLITHSSIKAVINGIRAATLLRLDHDVHNMHKLHLLRGCLEPLQDGTAVAHTVYLRHYLVQVRNFRHCHSLT